LFVKFCQIQRMPAGLDAPAARRLWVGALFLFLILAGIKLALLGSLSNHLYLAHWRIDSPDPAWLDFASFYLFVLLGPLTLALIGRSIAAREVRTIRWFNVGFIVAGLLFAFLTFERMKSNYLYPVLTGILNVTDVLNYLKMDLFFQRPYLVLYLLAYPLGYWILVRTGKEHWSFYLLGAAGAIFLLLNHRELILAGRELLAIDCLGLAGLFSLTARRTPLHWGWQVAPLAPVAAAWILFGAADHSLFRLAPYLVLVLSISLMLLGAANVLARRSAAFPVLSCFLPFYFLAFLLLSNRHYPMADNFNHLVVYALSATHYFWQEVMITASLLVAASCLLRRFSRAALLLFDAAALALIVASLIDLYLSQNMGFRLNWDALVVCNDAVLLWRTVQPYVGRLIMILLVLMGAYAGLFFLLGASKTAKALSPAWPSVGTTFPATCFVLLVCASPALVKPDKAEGMGLTHVLCSSPLVTGWQTRRLAPGEFSQVARRLDMPDRGPATHPAGPVDRSPRELNVLLVLMESSCNRYLSLFGAGDETQPRLKKYLDRMELFPNFYANFVNSLNARFSVVSGLYPCRPYVTAVTPRVPAPSLFELFHERGCVVSLFDSCHRDYQRWGDYLSGRRIDFFHDARTMPGAEAGQTVSWGISENVTLEAMKRQLGRHATNRERFFLTYMPVAPHMPFDSPSKEFEKFDNGVGHLNNNYTGRYKNQLLYMDWVITSLLEELDRLGLLEQTLVVITNDHGEMVGEDDKTLGHGWNLEPWLANVPLIVMDPQKKGTRVNYTLGSQVDILPTLLDLLNVPVPATDLYEGLSLYGQAAGSERTVYVSSHGPRALIRGSRYVVLDPNSESSGKAGNKVRAYEITHQGVKTHFRPIDDHPQVLAELDEFERFQKSFLVHYSYYRNLAHGREGGTPPVHARR
jgi:glucan phosphoethanolaminetransferase (alkaline phosphatase superfamily)